MSELETSFNKTPQEKGAPLTLEGRVDIFPQSPLPEFSVQGGPAFVARLRYDASVDMMAVLCTRGLAPRVDTITAMKTIDNPGVLRLREAGLLTWPEEGARYFALAYERPSAPRFWATLDETHAVMREDVVNFTFIAPMIRALLEFQRTGVVHGGIRPDNIFWREGTAAAPRMGEALSAPPGVGQPNLFETIERAMCPPLGRGVGAHVDDCYAFGVTAAFVILGHNPVRGMDDHAILQAKIEHGTFNTLIGTQRLAGSHIELLRGLLADDPRQRWAASDLEQWLTGRRLTPKNSDSGRRASRHFPLAGKEYWQVRALAAGLAANVNEAVKMVEDGSLQKWLMRSLGDGEKAKSVNEALEELKEGGKTAHYEDQLIARVCIALDPVGPIRYRGLCVMPAGIVTLLADAMSNNTPYLQVLSEIIANQLVTFWVNTQKEGNPELIQLAQLMERMRGYLDKSAFGSGIERVVYELNPTIPCLSPMLRKQCVITSRTMLAVLDHVASLPGRPTEPMDRHIAAFLLVRDRRAESLFRAMSPGAPSGTKGLALLTLFGEMQYRYGPDKASALAAWILPMVEPGVKRFFNKSFQEKVRKQAREAMEKGDLSMLLRVLDDPRRVQNDEQEFLRARLLHVELQKEIASIEAKLANKDKLTREVGRPVAATVASLLALVMISLILIRAALKGLETAM